jgi:hypothetical protein
MPAHAAPIDLDNLQSLNRYAYANNNPYRFVDPGGRNAIDVPFMSAAGALPATAPAVAPSTTPLTELLPEVLVQGTRSLVTTVAVASAATVTAIAALPVLVFTPSNGFAGHDFRDESVGAMMASKKPPKDAKDPNGAKAPGKPGEEEGFEDPKTGEEWARDDAGRGGWLDSKGNLWQPTGKGSLAHGGPHWDVQLANGGYVNIRPGEKFK